MSNSKETKQDERNKLKQERTLKSVPARCPKKLPQAKMEKRSKFASYRTHMSSSRIPRTPLEAARLVLPADSEARSVRNSVDQTPEADALNSELHRSVVLLCPHNLCCAPRTPPNALSTSPTPTPAVPFFSLISLSRCSSFSAAAPRMRSATRSAASRYCVSLCTPSAKMSIVGSRVDAICWMRDSTCGTEEVEDEAAAEVREDRISA